MSSTKLPLPTTVIAIDGPSGSGKGAVSFALAKWLGFHYLDSGALYRILGHLAAVQSVDLDDEQGLARLARQIDVAFVDGAVLLAGQNIDPHIRTEQAGERASKLAQLRAVRANLLHWQRQCARPPGLVADGRDMGTVVFSDAACKIFLTASTEARAERRYKQLHARGIDVTIREIFEQLATRDARDATRPISPLTPAADAVIVDTTALDLPQVIRRVQAIVTETVAE